MKIKKRPKYYYYFQWNLGKHFHFYKALKDVSQANNLDLKLITSIKYRDYINNKDLIKKYKSEGSHVIISVYHNLTTVLYFFFITLFNTKTIIHFKQSSPGRLLLLKKLFGSKLIFINDLEGDKISEREYLLTIAENRPLTEENKKTIEDLVYNESSLLNKFDYTFVYNEYFRRILKERHYQLRDQIYVSHLMSFRKGNLFFDKELREAYRNKLKWNNNYIVTYIGNVFYPWQNISKTIKIYNRIKNEINSNTKLLLLINKADHDKALQFIRKHRLIESDYLLTEVHNSEMNGYLCASDIGFVLRDFHTMNQVVTSGKLLDYLGSGLPVVTTSVFSELSGEIKRNKFGLVLDDLNIDNIQLDEIEKLLLKDFSFRENISKWANNNLSLDSSMKKYLSVLKNV